MTVLFSAFLGIADPREVAWRAVRASARLGASDNHGGWPEGLDLAGGTWNRGDGSTVSWESRESSAVGRVWTLSIDEPLPREAACRLRTRLSLQDDLQSCSVHALVQLRPAASSIRPILGIEAQAPRILQTVLAHSRVLDAGNRVSPAATLVDPDSLGPLSILVTDPRRQLPIVVVQDAPELAGHLVRSLCGVAHVVDARGSRAEELGALLQLDFKNAGDVDIIWPSWQLGDAAPLHERWIGRGRFDDLVVAARPICNSVIAATALRTPSVAPLERLMLDAEVRQRIETGSGDRTEQWDRDLRALRAASRDIADLEAEVRRLNDELDDVVGMLADRWDAEVAEGLRLMSSQSRSEPQSMGEAIERASSELVNLVVLPEALDQARQWQFLQPAKVFRHLCMLDSLVARWRSNRLKEGLHVAAQAAGLPWARDVSTSAHRLFPQDYTVWWNGRQLLLGPHLKYGSGPPTRQCRVYCAVVEEDKAVVVGHIGRHLRGARDH